MLEWASLVTNLNESTPLATPNYGYEKRQRELAKKKKKEEKLREKSERKSNPEPANLAQDDAAAVAPQPPADTE